MSSTDTLVANRAAIGLCNRLHDPLNDRVAFYADAARSSATRRAYASDMAAFSAWGGSVPSSPETVARTLLLPTCWLPQRDGRVSQQLPTPTRLSAILTRLGPLVRKVFRGIRRVHGARADAATPLDIDMLARIVSALPEDLTAIRDRAMLLVGFFCALRRSELVALAVEDLDRQQTAGTSPSSAARPIPTAGANTCRCQRSGDLYVQRLPWRTGWQSPRLLKAHYSESSAPTARSAPPFLPRKLVKFYAIVLIKLVSMFSISPLILYALNLP